jgi:hypothetical protein
MPPRQITLCEDETSHPQICLVAIEPVSNFLLLEQYQPQRDATTWDRCLDEKLAGLPVSDTSRIPFPRPSFPSFVLTYKHHSNGCYGHVTRRGPAVAGSCAIVCMDLHLDACFLSRKKSYLTWMANLTPTS